MYPNIAFTETAYQKALEYQASIKDLTQGEHSIRGDDAVAMGALAEMTVHKWLLKHSVGVIDVRSTRTDIDYIIGSGIEIDVKSVDRVARPRTNYGCNISKYNHEHQQPDYFVMVSMLRDKSFPSEDIRRYRRAFIVGAATMEIVEAGEHIALGDVHPLSGRVCHEPYIDVIIDELIKPVDFMRALR